MKSVKKLYRMLLLCICLAMVVPVTGIAATNSVSIMYIGSKKTEKTLSVKTSNKKVVSVKKSGKKTIITPKSVGEATLKYYKGKKLKKKVSVLVLNKNSVLYDTNNLAIEAGKTKTVKAIMPKGCKVSYSSSKKAIATVNSKGVIKGKKNGSCTITAKVTYKGKTVKTFKKKVTVNKTGLGNNTSGNTDTSGKGSNTGGNGKDTGNEDKNNSTGNNEKNKPSKNNASDSKSPSGNNNTSDNKENGGTSSGSGSSGPGAGSSDEEPSLESITASCNKESVQEGYRFTLDDFVIYGNYSDGSKKRIYNFSITASYASSNGYYEVAVDSQGMSAKIKVPVSKKDTGDGNDKGNTSGGSGSSGPGTGSSDEEPSLESITASCTKESVQEGYHFTSDDFVVYGNYSDGSKKRIYSFSITASYESSNSYYEVTVDSQGMSAKIKVPVSKKDTGDGNDKGNTPGGSGSSEPGTGSSDEEPSLESITASCTKESVQEGYHFTLSDFVVYGNYSDGSQKRIYSFSITASYASSNGYYEVTVDSQGKVVKIKVPVSSGSGSSEPGTGSSDEEPSLESITASCTKESVQEGYHFTSSDFVVYGNYSDGSQKRIYSFRITASYTSSNGYYEVAIDTQGKVVKVKVPVSKNGADNTDVPSQDNQPAKAEAVGIEVEFAKTEITEDYDFPMSDFTVYTVYSDGSKKLASGFGFQTSYKDGYYYITVTSGGFEKVLKVKAAESGTEPTVTRVKFSLTSNTVKVGETFAPGQIKVTAFYSNGTEKEVTDFTHDFTPKTEPGQYTVNITWGTFKSTVTVNVVSNEAVLQSADIKFARQFLYLDEQPTKDDIIVTGTYSDGTTKPVTDFTFTFTPAKGHGQKAELIVTIGGKSTTLSIPCYDRNIPVGLHMTLTKSVIKVNENIDPSTIILDVEYRDGRKTVETDFTLDFTPKSTPGSYPVVLTFRGETLEFTIDVVE